MNRPKLVENFAVNANKKVAERSPAGRFARSRMTFRKYHPRTFGRLSSKLVAVLVALESMLLNDGSEPIQQNLSERIAFLFGPEKRSGIKKSVIRAYSLRSKFIHHGHIIGTDEIDTLREFLLNVWAAFLSSI